MANCEDGQVNRGLVKQPYVIGLWQARKSPPTVRGKIGCWVRHPRLQHVVEPQGVVAENFSLRAF